MAVGATPDSPPLAVQHKNKQCLLYSEWCPHADIKGRALTFKGVPGPPSISAPPLTLTTAAALNLPQGLPPKHLSLHLAGHPEEGSPYHTQHEVSVSGGLTVSPRLVAMPSMLL